MKVYTGIFWGSAVLFLALSGAVAAHLLYGFDLWAVDASRVRTSEALDLASEVFSVLGNIEVTAPLVLLVAIWLVLHGDRVLGGRLLAAFVAAGLIEVLMKFFLPQVPLPDELSRASGAPNFELPYDYPYPSGHMLRAVILLGTVALLWKNRLARVLAVVLLIGMAASRVYLGVHWASDVAGGALLGTAALAWAFKERKRRS